MSDDEEVGFFVASRVTLQLQKHVPGSKIITANCGHRVWVSPTGQFHLATPSGAGMYVLCDSCQLITDKTVERRALPESMDELERAFGRQYAAVIRAALAREGIELDKGEQ